MYSFDEDSFTDDYPVYDGYLSKDAEASSLRRLAKTVHHAAMSFFGVTMAYSIGIIDDSDDFVILPHGCTTGRAGAMAKDPSALLELNKRLQPHPPAAYVVNAED
ncbi:hypothetical protein SLS58_006407 [Diplodia intermedia]|uniref:Uncharacterized protein n=1 Tax=Diplodia intermedia TaxID=856260 RepID=A0ABR3TN00_9PEZI